MKCPFCDSIHVLKDGFDETSMDIWRCMSCGETITQVDIDIQESSANDDDDDEYNVLDDDGIQVWFPTEYG